VEMELVEVEERVRLSALRRLGPPFTVQLYLNIVRSSM